MYIGTIVYSYYYGSVSITEDLAGRMDCAGVVACSFHKLQSSLFDDKKVVG